ncbi:pleckstrin homology domain-containing family M member 1 [Rhinophrynus dorsalis]
MLSSNTSENALCPRDVKQRITKKLATSLRALQIRYVTTDDVITSDDDDANSLCVALEAVFVHGLKAKFIKTQVERRHKSRHVPLPQPAYWALLKAITHRNVIAELEKASYINTDVGRCRSWLRLALNDCLMECYFISLQREKSQLMEYYQPFALLLDAEDCDVVLSYLQGLSSLTFSLSYKSSVLNEWTATPLSLSGLWLEDTERLVPGQYEPRRRKSLDSVSLSSSSDDTNSSMLSESKGKLQSSSLSLDTNSSSSQLSSSIGSEEPPQITITPTSVQSGGSEDPCDADTAETEESDKSHAEDIEFGLSPASDGDSPSVFLHSSVVAEPISKNKSQELKWEGDSVETETRQTISLLKPYSRNYLTSRKDPVMSLSTTHDTTGKQTDLDRPQSTATEICDQTRRSETGPNYLEAEHPASDLTQKCDQSTESEYEKSTESSADPSPVAILQVRTSTVDLHKDPRLSPPTILPVRTSTIDLHKDPQLSPAPELPKSRSWISEDDFQRPEPTDQTQPGHFLPSQPLNHEITYMCQPQDGTNKAFNVVHKRQIGLYNPFRGLLMMGFLERRNTLGLYKSFYCELTPIEFRLFLKGEERICFENFTLLRCESVGPAQSDGRFELQFPAKRLYLRAPSADEAQDWVDRLQEALQKCRPQKDEQWEVLQCPVSPEDDLESQIWPPCKDSAIAFGSVQSSEVFDWTSQLELEPDALKESVLYMKVNKKWTRFIFSLSERGLKCFIPKNSEKVLYNTFCMEMVKDIMPDSSLGSPSCFRLVTSKGSLQLQAESSVEAKTWRELVRAAYLESEEDWTLVPGEVNFQIKSHIREHALFQYLLHIPTEKGLDSQNFKCAACHKQIGFQFGKAKRCAFSALYYCEWCHKDEGTIIPSRMVHNWDITEQAVSRQAINFLNMVRNEPLINLQSVNARLCHHTQTMLKISQNRERLRLLGEYLMTCRSGALQELSKSLDNRNYLLDCAHIYSVRDLKQIADGVFESFLGSLLDFACKHVYDCDLCSQRGFICQICNGNEIIYPFQFETTTRCSDCKSVFHTPCKMQRKQCPRCLRRKKYQNQYGKM